MKNINVEAKYFATTILSRNEKEHQLLTQANQIGLEIEFITYKVNYSKLQEAIILYQQLNIDGKFFVHQANIYNVPVKMSHLQDIMSLHYELEDYEELLHQAKQLNINWDFKKYNPILLSEAIIQAKLLRN